MRPASAERSANRKTDRGNSGGGRVRVHGHYRIAGQAGRLGGGEAECGPERLFRTCHRDDLRARRRRGAFCRRRRARCLVRRVCARRQRPECLGRPLRLGPAIGTSRVPHAGRHAALGESGNRGRRVRDHARRGRARSLGLPGGRACLRPGLHGAGQGRPGTSRGVVARVVAYQLVVHGPAVDHGLGAHRIGHRGGRAGRGIFTAARGGHASGAAPLYPRHGHLPPLGRPGKVAGRVARGKRVVREPAGSELRHVAGPRAAGHVRSPGGTLSLRGQC